MPIRCGKAFCALQQQSADFSFRSHLFSRLDVFSFLSDLISSHPTSSEPMSSHLLSSSLISSTTLPCGRPFSIHRTSCAAKRSVSYIRYLSKTHFARDFPQNENVEDVTTKLSCETSFKNWKLKMWKYVKTKLSCETSLKMKVDNHCCDSHWCDNHCRDSHCSDLQRSVTWKSTLW